MQLSFKNGSKRNGVLRLADLAENESALLDRIDLPDDLAHRLMEIGFVPGNAVSAARCAPGGDPRVFRVDGSEIALRRETAKHIILKPAAGN